MQKTFNKLLIAKENFLLFLAFQYGTLSKSILVYYGFEKFFFFFNFCTHLFYNHILIYFYSYLALQM